MGTKLSELDYRGEPFNNKRSELGERLEKVARSEEVATKKDLRMIAEIGAMVEELASPKKDGEKPLDIEEIYNEGYSHLTGLTDQGLDEDGGDVQFGYGRIGVPGSDVALSIHTASKWYFEAHGGFIRYIAENPLKDGEEEELKTGMKEDIIYANESFNFKRRWDSGTKLEDLNPNDYKKYEDRILS